MNQYNQPTQDMQGGNSMSRGDRVANNRMKQGRDGEGEDPVDVDDIQFENKLDYDDDDDDNSPNNQYYQQPRTNPQQYAGGPGAGQPSSGGSGKAGRIGAFRKSNPALNGDDSGALSNDRRRRTEAIRSPNNPYPFSNEADDDDYSPDRIGGMELDSKLAHQNLLETEQVAEIVNQIEGNYGKAKKKINGYDVITLEADIVAQTLNACYSTIDSCLSEENEAFDQEKMNTKLDQILNKVRSNNSDYNKFKGEFQAANEPIINKDILAFKVDRVQRYLEKQEQVLTKLPSHEDVVKENQSTLIQLKKKYENFENNLFEKKVEETRLTIKDTETLVDKIEEKQEQLNKLVEDGITNHVKVTPQNNEQRQKYQKIHQDLIGIQKRIEDSEIQLNQNLKEKTTLDTKHDECEAIVKDHHSVEIVNMIAQSRQMKTLVETHRKWVALYKKLKNLQDEELESIENFLGRAISATKKYAEGVNQEQRDEYNDILRKIQKYAKKVQDDVDEQNARLENFEKKVLGDPQNPNTFIADADLLILRKEVARNKGAIESTRTMTFEILEESQYIKDDGQKGFDKLISQKDLKSLKSNLKSLQKQDQVDVPRIKANIDALEGFSVKSLKNQLNDDNKKSQSQISAMKKSFEDLQKKIDQLNKKHDNIKVQVAALSDSYEDEDLERENDFINKIHDKLTGCDRDINGDNRDGRGDASDREDAQLDKLKSLQSRKKMIISKINAMVGQFNENNKMIKEANKVQRSEKEMSELIAANKKIQEECSKIHDKINAGKEFAVEINDRLDKIIDPTLPKLREKYDGKKRAIEACDTAYNDNTDMLTDQEKALKDELEKINAIIAKLETVNPINNPSIPGKDNTKFLKDVSAKLDQANKYRDDLEAMQEQMNKTKDDMDNMIDPLNELADRVVPKDEIDDILKDLQAMNKELNGNQRDILPLKQGISSLMGDVEQMLERDKGRKIDEAEKNLNDLDGNINNLENKLDDVINMLNEYKNKIAKAKTQEGRDDPELLAKLKELEAEAKGLERDVGDLEGKINDLKKKRNDSKKLLDDIKKNPHKYNPQQIDQLLVGLGDQVERAEGINDKADGISADLVRRMKELDDLLLRTGQRKGHQADINAAIQQMLEDFASFQGVLDKVPKQIEMMLQTLKEMEIGAGPDKTADYWEEREQIKKHIEALIALRGSLEQLGKVFTKKKGEFDGMQARLRTNPDNDGLKKLAADLKNAAVELQDYLNQCFDARDGVNDIKDEMGDCEIPVNISVRRNEVQAYLERLERIKMDFRDMKQGDDDYEGEQGSEREIKALIKEIEQKIKGYDSEGRDLSRYQNQKLDMYSEKEFLGYNIAHIVIEVREFKVKVFEAMQKLQDLEDLCSDLNNKLIQQDMDNATVLLTKKSHKLRERLIAAQKGLKKISNCGDEMDGNTTHNEEDEFIDALKDEMPEVFKNIDMNFEQIDGIDVLLKTVVETKDIEKMSLLKKEIDDANNKVEQSEGLVVKLENEIVEWNAFKKLCRRDEELQEIESLLKDFNLDLNDEVKLMEKELQKNSNKMEKEDDPKGQLQQQRIGITNYMDEIDELQKYIADLNAERDDCFKEFNNDLPRIVQEARVKRNQMADFNSPNTRAKKAQTTKAQTKGIDFPVDSDKPSDIYYMITINCRYRKRIHEMLKELRNINQRRRELEEKYAALKRELSAVKVAKIYKPMKGDAVDELFAQHMNKACLNLPVKRLAPGKYLFGTKQILAKIINGKLVIRVGGGYMSADEFIEQYGKIEIMKLMREQEQNSADGKSGRGVGKMDGMPAAGIADMKEVMKNQMMNVKVYEAASHSPTGGGFGSGRQQADMVKQTSKRTLVQLESKYEMATISKQGLSPAPHRSNRLDMTGPSPLRNQGGLMQRQGSNDNFGKRLGSPGAGRR